MTSQEIISYLPYREPFLFVDELTAISETAAEGYYTFREDAFFYKGHFKHEPVTPGVILSETMAQIGVVSMGIYLLKDEIDSMAQAAIALTSHSVDFFLPIFPGERVKVSSEREYYRFDKLKCKVQLFNSKNELACRGTISGMFSKRKKMNRVVVTGMGVVAPNGVGLTEFTKAIREGKSGITYHQDLKDLGFSCCIGGIPRITEELKLQYFSQLQLRGFNSNGILYGCIAGVDAWKDAGFDVSEHSEVDFDSGMVFGSGSSGIEKFRESIYLLDDKKVRRLGSTTVVQTMASGVSAYLGGMLGLGNQVTTNSSACTTGTEALLMGFERVRRGYAKRMLVGSCSDDGPYIWGGFDAMRVLTYKHNDAPEEGSRPMSATAAGFVPGGGAGAIVLESLESAQERNAPIYAEVLGGAINSGGQRNGGTMTAPNSDAVQRCIRAAVNEAGIDVNEIDAINGHLTATIKDPVEIENWASALNRRGSDFPYISSLKSMVGHCLAAAGAVECVASVLQLKHGFVSPNINCDDVHPDILEVISDECIPKKKLDVPLKTLAKASFGFGDVNACVIFKTTTE